MFFNAKQLSALYFHCTRKVYFSIFSIAKEEAKVPENNLASSYI